MKRFSYALLRTLFIGLSLYIYSCRHVPDEVIVNKENIDTIQPPFDTIACDSSKVTYQGIVYPILNAYCISCHAPPTPQAGIDLTDFTDVSFIAQSGKLMGAIKHENGFVPMPQDAPKLTDCEIGLIQKWINDTTFIEPGIPCDPDTVYFQNTVLPLLQSSCGTTGCHDPVTHENDVILTSYYYVMQTAEVQPFQPEESKLWEVIANDFVSNRMPPAPSAPLNADQKQIIYNWISQGALDNYCENEPCDSVNVTFSGSVFPIIQNNCYGCHSGPSPGGGMSLTNYSQIKTAGAIPPGNAGSLLGVISWTSGNLPMPQNGNKLSDCNIAKIRKWIEYGMPDN